MAAGKKPPHQWYNQLPGHAERFLTWCAYPKRGTLRNLKKQKHWDKVTKEWEVHHIDFYAVSRIIVADNADASALVALAAREGMSLVPDGLRMHVQGILDT